MTRTADAWTGTAREIRGTLADVERLLSKDVAGEGGGALETRADALVTRTLGEAESLVDHAAWRLAQLLGLALVLALAYRFLSGRIARPA
jgi:hypothetical protein